MTADPLDLRDPPRWAPYYDCPPGKAVRRFFTKYADFTGRASRSEYWWTQLVGTLVYLALAGAVMLAGLPDSDPTGPELGQYIAVGFALVYALVIFVPSLALTVRRLHDANLSGLLVLLGAVPYVGELILVVLALLPPNADGERFDDRDYQVTREGYATTRSMDPDQEPPPRR